MEEAVRYTVDLARDPSGLSDVELAELNVRILERALGHRLSVFLETPTNFVVQFSVHRITGFIRQIPNKFGWIFTDADDAKCSVVIASDTRKPIVVCDDEQSVTSRTMDVICAMEECIHR